MKKTNVSFILLSLLLLASCGQGGKTSASLKVSSSFALSNSGFDGGFVLYGKNGTQSFSRAVSYAAGSAGNVVDIILPNGKWSFYATAWKNSAAGGPMTGDVLCGLTSADLKGSDVKLSLSVSQDACALNDFTNTQMRDGTGPNRVKKLTLVSCNNHYDWSSGNPLPIDGSTNFNFCNHANVPLDLRNQAKSFRARSEGKALANESVPAGFNGLCQDFNLAGNSAKDSEYRIPSSNTPVVIDLFKGPNCTDLLVSQPMLEGVTFNYGDDKTFINVSGTHGGLVVASNEARKGLSHFINVMPVFKCSTNLCVAQHLTGPYELYAARPLSATPLRVNLDYDPNTSSASYTITIPALQKWNFSGGTQAAACGKDGETFYCDLILDATCSAPFSNNCFSSHGSSPSFQIGFQKPGVSTTKRAYIFQNHQDFAALKTAYQFTGISANGPLMSDKDRLDEDDAPLHGSYGLLQTPRMVLSPAIAGAASLPGQNCTSASGTKQIQLREEGTTKTYEISIENNRDLGIGLNTYEKFFFCLTSAYNTGSCSSPEAPYEKRITIRRLLSPGNWEKFLTMEFSCDQTRRSGRFHEENTEYHSGTSILKRRKKTVIAWFTPPGTDKDRIEVYNGSREFDISSVETRYEALFARLYKTSSSNFGINGMLYKRNYSGANFDESAGRFFIQLTTSFLEYDFLPIQKSGSTVVADIFNSVTPADYEFNFVDIRPILTRANVTQKIDLNLMTLTTGSYTFVSSDPTATSLGGLSLTLSSMKPVPFYGVFNDSFF